jgi:hypothetical protein
LLGVLFAVDVFVNHIGESVVVVFVRPQEERLGFTVNDFLGSDVVDIEVTEERQACFVFRFVDSPGAVAKELAQGFVGGLYFFGREADGLVAVVVELGVVVLGRHTGEVVIAVKILVEEFDLADIVPEEFGGTLKA